ncbi:MAG: TonB-dependent receptor [Methylovulum sp.]|uniref:TonB-dependent receptor domain-containing protein n=1 Tax=Methylovulum sp. TaxID=1916980 RepID=UPI00260654A4|nr:TonB-dependent receptor [Methylovulum sp.]MDD2722817.1 TonB-dependent receptor [Methylovulum sp.]MDD5125522.1 TonB-dependent receptor [Methylovulum sp.]
MQKIIANSVLLLIPISSLQAAQPVNLPGVIVTATRTETLQNELAAGATVYTRQDIDRLQVKTLPDLFKGTLGLDIAQSGGYGQPTDLFLRGTNPGHVLVLIDGIKVGSATVGTTPYELLPMDQIERVEIIRGPQSSLYGSEAIGGVIQIFTRKGSHDDEKPQVSLQAGGGSYDTAHTAGTVSGKLGANWYNLGVSHIDSQGFNAKRNSDPDRDGYENTGVNARVGHRFANDAEIEAFFMRSQGTNDYDSSFGGNNSAFVNQVFGLTGKMDVLESWHTLLRLGRSNDDLDTFFPDGSFESRYNTTRWNASWLNQVQLSDAHQLTLGADYRFDEVESGDLDTFSPGFNTYSQRSRYDAGLFTELHSRLLDHHFLNASVRGDKNEAFGDYVTGNVGWRYNSAFGISPFASFGNAFKAPTFNELYWPDTGFGGGNPHLKPEESQSVEVGLAGDHGKFQWELRAYHTDVEQLISGWPPVNVNKARIEGIEAQISTDLFGWHHKLNLNLLDPVDVATGLRLQRRSDKSLSFDVSRSFGEFDVGGYVLAQGDRPDLDFSTFPVSRVNLPGFVTVDLRTAWHINKNWMLSGKLNNLLDEKYQTAYGYNTPDRNFFVSVHYNH